VVAIAGAVLLVALMSAAITSEQPLVALAIPGILVLAIVCTRWPTFAVLVLLAMCAAYGSLFAFWGIPSGPVVDAILGALWLGVLYTYAVKSRTRPWWVWPGLAVTLLYIVISFFQMWTALGVSLGLFSFKYSTWYLMAVPLLAFAGWQLGTYVRIARVLVFAALAVSLYAVFRLIFGVSGPEWSAAMQTGAGTFNTVEIGELSLIGSFQNRHELAFWSAMTVPFCFAIALAPGPRLWRLVAAAAIPLALVATFGTDVRIAIPAIAAGVAVVLALNLVASRGRGKPLAQMLIAVLLAIVGGTALFTLVLGEEEQARYGAIVDPQGDTSFDAHLQRWEAVLAELDEQPLGFGLATAGRLQQSRMTPYVTIGSYSIDNTYLKIAYEQGIPVLLLFIAAMIGLFVGLARRAVRARAGPVRGMAIGAAGTLVPVLVMFLTGQYIETIAILFAWVALGAAIGALGAVREEEMERTGQDPEATPHAPPPAPQDSRREPLPQSAMSRA
jgi:hypothetical protein